MHMHSLSLILPAELEGFVFIYLTQTTTTLRYCRRKYTSPTFLTEGSKSRASIILMDAYRSYQPRCFNNEFVAVRLDLE